MYSVEKTSKGIVTMAVSDVGYVGLSGMMIHQPQHVNCLDQRHRLPHLGLFGLAKVWLALG